MPNKKLKTYFANIYDPLKVTEEDQQELRAVLKAIIDISGNEGSILKLQDTLLTNETLKYTAHQDYNMAQLKRGKQIFDECQDFDLKKHGTNRLISQNLSANFQNLNRDIVFGKEAYDNPSIDQIAWKSMGQHKALNEGDLSKYNALKQNQMTTEEIIDYLENKRKSDLYSDEIFSDDSFGANGLQVKQGGRGDEEWFNFDGFDDDEKEYRFQNDVIKDVTTQKQVENEKLKIKMFDELENIDLIIKSSEDNIKLTKSQYLLHLRHIYHEKVTALRQQKDLFRTQLNRMQRAHSQQIKNIENFALSIAIEMFRKKGQQVRELFQVEATHLIKDYNQIHSLISFYEKKFTSLTFQMANQERLLINQFLFLNDQSRKKKHYTAKKEEAKTILQELMNERYARIPPKEYMNETFDFFGQGLRVANEGQKSILKSLVFKRQEKETMNYKIQVKLVRNEVEVMKLLLESAQDQEAKTKIKLHETQKKLEKEKGKFQALAKKMANEHAEQIKKMQEEVIEFAKQDQQYRKLVSFEIEVLHKIIMKQKEGNDQLNRYKNNLKMTQHILRYPVLSKEYHQKVKKYQPFDLQNQFKLIREIYDKHINDDPKLLMTVSNKEQKLRGRSSPILEYPENILNQNQQQTDALSDDVKQYLGDFIDINKRGNHQNSSQNYNSTTTRVFTTQNKDNNQTSLTKTSIDWNLYNNQRQYNDIEQLRPSNNTYSSIDTGYSHQQSRHPQNLLSLPTTRAQMRGTGYPSFNVNDPLLQSNDPFSHQLQKPPSFLNSLESKRRNLMNLSLNNFGLSSGVMSIPITTTHQQQQMPDLSSHRAPLLTQRAAAAHDPMLPICANKRFLENQLNKRHQLKRKNDSLIYNQQLSHTKEHDSQRSKYQRQAFYRRQKQFSLNERTVINPNSGGEEEQEEYEKQKIKIMKRFTLNQSVDIVITRDKAEPVEVERGIVFDEGEIISIFSK